MAGILLGILSGSLKIYCVPPLIYPGPLEFYPGPPGNVLRDRQSKLSPGPFYFFRKSIDRLTKLIYILKGGYKSHEKRI